MVFLRHGRFVMSDGAAAQHPVGAGSAPLRRTARVAEHGQPPQDGGGRVGCHGRPSPARGLCGHDPQEVTPLVVLAVPRLARHVAPGMHAKESAPGDLAANRAFGEASGFELRDGLDMQSGGRGIHTPKIASHVAAQSLADENRGQGAA